MIAPPKPPSHDELEALTKEARARQLRRRLLGAAPVAIAAAIALATHAVVGGRIHTSTTNGYPVGAPLCRTEQLVARGGLNGAVGTMLGPVTITNTSSTACSLPAGRPGVHILWHDRVLPARETDLSDPPGRAVRLLGPHSTAAITMAWSNWCGKPSEGTVIRPTFQLRWADGLGVDASNVALTPPRCGLRTTGSVIQVSVPETD